MINLKKLLLIFAFASLTQAVSAQTENQDDEVKKRDVISNVFTQNRPVAGKSAVPSRQPLPRKKYKGKKVLRAKAKRKRQLQTKSVAAQNEERLGITLWRLRSERNGDTGARILSMGNNSKFVAERVSFETSFRPKEKVRLSVEAPRDGYLYVIDREIYKNGILGDAYLIFPTLLTRKGDNRVGAGTVVEIPAQSDEPSYFDITPLSKDYAGEMLTVIVSPTPLPNLRLQDEPLNISAATIARWEEDWEENADVLELEDGEKIQYTEAEKKAGQGASKITQNDPPPQTLFEINVPKGRTFMVSFPMKVSSEK